MFIYSVKQDTLLHEKKISYTTEHLISLKVKVIFIISEEQLVAVITNSQHRNKSRKTNKAASLHLKGYE